jgi:hypothetical protein
MQVAHNDFCVSIHLLVIFSLPSKMDQAELTMVVASRLAFDKKLN